MRERNPEELLGTHEVKNQGEAYEDVSYWEADAALREAVDREGGGFAVPGLASLGARVGSARVQQWAEQANREPPVLRTFDRYGRRLDEVEFHPAWHRLMALGLEARVASIAWTAPRGGHVAHAALLYLLTQADAGVCCPFSMTYACIPALRREPALAREWEPGVLAACYDERSLPAAEKAGVTIGMAMTEKQGGSDVRANTTRARRLAAEGEYELTGHKWFCSAPMSDAFLALAQADDGLTCFLVPRWTPDGTRNALRLVRLKDKLGDRSNASAEVEYEGAYSRRVGPEGEGVRTIIAMVQGTRLDCLAGSAGLMRAALANAVAHARRRHAFGRALVHQPAMERVLADLALEWEAAVALTFRSARAFDEAQESEEAAALARVLTPVAKYLVCKRAPGLIGEAMECLGGNGYVEESPLPRLYRQAPVNAIWEGSGNVIALDALRAIARSPASLDALLAELGKARGADPLLDRALDTLAERAGELEEENARHFAESAAVALQAALLVRHGAEHVARAFIQTRLGNAAGRTYGAWRADIDAEALIARILVP